MIPQYALFASWVFQLGRIPIHAYQTTRGHVLKRPIAPILEVILTSASSSFHSLARGRLTLLLQIRDLFGSACTRWATYLTRPGISTGHFLYLSSSLLSRHSTMALITKPSRLPRLWMPSASNSEHMIKPVALMSSTQSGCPCSTV